MSLLGSLGDLIKALIKKIVDFVKKLFKKLWPLILLVVVVIYAPVIGGWLSANGATWLGSAFSWVGTNVTPWVSSTLSSIWSGAKALAGKAWSAFKGLELGQQASIITGASALLAPEETAAVLGEAASLATDLFLATAGGIVSSVLSNPIALVALGVGAYWLLGGFSSSSDTEQIDGGSYAVGAVTDEDDTYDEAEDAVFEEVSPANTSNLGYI